MKTIIVVDGHNFSYRSLYTLPKPKSGKYLAKKQERNLFKGQLVSQLMNLLNTWRSVAESIVFTWDFGSWRKDSLKSEFEGEVDYKGTRNTEEKVDMKRFAECITEFKNNLTACKIEQCEIFGAEGDDWIAAIARRFNGNGDRIIIYSNDGDLHQLVVDGVMQLARNVDKYNFFVSPSDYEKLTSRSGVNVLEDMLNGGLRDSDFLRMLLNEMVAGKKLEILPIRGQESLFRKIMTGDRSDNIPSVCRVVKNGRTYGISEKMSDAVLSGFYEKSGVDEINVDCYSNTELCGLLCESIMGVAKDKLKYEGDIESVRHGLERNIKYVMLGSGNMPKELMDAMSARIDMLERGGAYINWSAVDSFNTNGAGANVMRNVEMNALNKVLDKDERGTDWSFIKKDNEGGKLF